MLKISEDFTSFGGPLEDSSVKVKLQLHDAIYWL